MDKLKLYLDCDGVILDTIAKSYEILKKNNITDEEERQKFYKNVNWDELIILSGQIDDSISKIKKLTDYFDVEILTHVYTKKEGTSKINYFKKELPYIKVTIVPKTMEKADFVSAEGCILVDDYLGNLTYWSSHGGISVKFSNTGKKYENCYVIKDLLELLEINFSEKVKAHE